MDTSFSTRFLILFSFLTTGIVCLSAQGTRLLRQPSVSADHIAFVYGGDIWTCQYDGSDVRRITSTPAVESVPHWSPDGQWLAFSSNRGGTTAVYIVSKEGGDPKRLTWHPAAAQVRGWTPDGKSVLYASWRGAAPVPYNKLWTISVDGGPATLVSKQWGFDGSYSPDGKLMVLDRMSRWDGEWRNYRGGQNTPLIVLNLDDNSEQLLPHDKTTDIQPTWHKGEVYFLSDRDWTMNVWAYAPKTGELRQVTKLKATDVKYLAAGAEELLIEQNGYLHWVNPANGQTRQLNIDVKGDFPWAATSWEDVSRRVRNVSLSPTAKRVLMEARGEVWTVPVEHGAARNLTQSSTAADREPLWSPKGDKVAWFSDEGGEYALYLADQDGRTDKQRIDIGESKMAWNPAWSPDGKLLAFTDDDVRIRIVNLETKNVQTVAIGGTNLDRGGTGLTWASDSKHLAYVVTGGNNLRQIKVWNAADDTTESLTNTFADARSPAWDRDGKHLYFLASTDVALGSGWANTSAMQADPEYAVYVVVLQEDGDSPFVPRSDEEEVEEEDDEEKEEEEKEEGEEKSDDATMEEEEEEQALTIDYANIERRTIALPMPEGRYRALVAGPKGSCFVGERPEGGGGLTLHKFVLKDREAKEFAGGVRQFTLSADGKKILMQAGPGWKIASASGASGKKGESVKVNLKMKLDRQAEWKQMFEEAWRYERDYFYDPDLHGRDWQKVYNRYAPLIPYVRHRSDLNYILDQVNGELSVGHSFVFGGDYPEVAKNQVGLLGADLVAANGRWQIDRIYTTESWNPELTSPLDRPGMKVQKGYYLVGINGQELTADDNPYMLLDGTLGQQTTLHINETTDFNDAWEEVVEPIRSERALRQRAWVEDNRRRVDALSGGRLAYVWVPNTSGRGFVSFNRYYFAQQDKEGAVIDERFNGGGLLDDYMVDLMTRSLRAAITNEVPNGKPFRLPAGILGPKVLLINERAGSGGDFFPWVFRHQQAGPLIGATTWGGLVKSSVHYPLVDGGALTAPDNAVFDPATNSYIGENIGIAPDIPVRQTAQALEAGGDPQLERAVEELLRTLGPAKNTELRNPPYPSPAKQK